MKRLASRFAARAKRVSGFGARACFLGLIRDSFAEASAVGLVDRDAFPGFPGFAGFRALPGLPSLGGFGGLTGLTGRAAFAAFGASGALGNPTARGD